MDGKPVEYVGQLQQQVQSTKKEIADKEAELAARDRTAQRERGGTSRSTICT